MAGRRFEFRGGFGTVFVLLFFCVSCGALRPNPYYVRLPYDTPVSSSGEIAYLVASEKTTISRLDEQTAPSAGDETKTRTYESMTSSGWLGTPLKGMPYNYRAKIEILPGPHIVEAYYQHIYLSVEHPGTYEYRRSYDVQQLQFAAESGHIYQVQAKYIGPGKMQLHVADITNNAEEIRKNKYHFVPEKRFSEPENVDIISR